MCHKQSNPIDPELFKYLHKYTRQQEIILKRNQIIDSILMPTEQQVSRIVSNLTKMSKTKINYHAGLFYYFAKDGVDVVVKEFKSLQAFGSKFEFTIDSVAMYAISIVACKDIPVNVKLSSLSIVIYEQAQLIMYAAICSENISIIIYIGSTWPKIKQDETICAFAASMNKLAVLDYLHKCNFMWDSLTCTRAARRGYLTCLKYAHRNECPWNEETYEAAVKGGHLSCIKYLHKQLCPVDKFDHICTCAAKYGHLECLQYLHEQGYTWDEDTCAFAAGHGQLECLRYLHEHGCPWNENTCIEAAAFGKLECLQYAVEHGCEFSYKAFICAKIGNYNNCVTYIEDHFRTLLELCKIEIEQMTITLQLDSEDED